MLGRDDKKFEIYWCLSSSRGYEGRCDKLGEVYMGRKE